MANVSFKRGLSTALSSITPVDGEFYLTTDSHKLYVGQTDNGKTKMHLVNDNVPEVYVVESVANNAVANPVEGALYYVAEGNSLYIYNNGFVKVNDFDTNEDHIAEVSSASFAKAVSQETGKLKYTLTINQKSKDLVLNSETAMDAVTADLIIDGSDVTGIVADVAVSPTLSISNGVVYLKNDGAGAGPDAVIISGGGATTVSGNGATLTISSPEYSFSGDENGQLVFTGVNGDTTTITLSDIFYTKNEANSQFSSAMRYKGTISNINLNNISNPEVGDVYMTSVAGTYVGTEEHPIYGWSDGVAAGVGDLFIYTKDGDNNYWSYVPSANDTDTTYTVSVDAENKTFDLAASSNSDKQSVKIDGEKGITVTANSINKSFNIGHSNTSTASSASVTATATLSFGESFTIYDALTVDTYGHVNAASKKTYQLPTIPTIPSYSLTSSVTTSGASIQFKKDDSEQDEIKLLRGDEMTVSQSGSAITVSHATVSLSKPTAAKATITNNTSIPSYVITTNSFGHVTAITETDYKFSVSQAVSVSDNVASVTMKDADSNNLSNFNVTSSSMKVTAKDNSTVNVEIEWGSF